MPFTKGSSGNPSGRAPGSRNRATLLRDSLAEDVPAIIAVLVEQAKGGDIQAARLILERTLPPVKAAGPTIEVELEGFACGDLKARAEAVTVAMGQGHIPVDVGQALMATLNSQASVIETTELADRIARLEAALHVDR